MWFKSVTGFRFVQPIAYTAEELHELFSPLICKSLGAYTPNTYGWTPALGGQSQNLAHGVGECILIGAKKIQKVVPASVIKEQLDDKVSNIEHAENRKVRSKEKRKLREEVLFELYPKALHQSVVTRAFIDTSQQWLLIDSTSPPMIKNFVALWERTLPSIKCVPFEVNAQLAHRFAKWLSEEPEGEFELANDCMMFDPRQSRRNITFKHQNLLSSEVHAHLSSGHLVGQLALNWSEQVSFVLDNNLSLRRLRFDAVATDQFEHVPVDDPMVRLDTDFALMSGCLRQCLLDLIDSLGGFVAFNDKTRASASSAPTPEASELA